LAASLGPGSATLWQTLFMVPIVLCLIPFPPLTAQAALSPLVVVGVIDPALTTALNAPNSFFHLPVAWSGALVPLAGAVVAHYLWRSGRMRRSAPAATVLAPRTSHN